MAVIEKPVIVIFENEDAVKQQEGLFRSIFDLYQSNRELMTEISVKANPITAPLVNKLLSLNQVELDLIGVQWQSFFQKFFEKPIIV